MSKANSNLIGSLMLSFLLSLGLTALVLRGGWSLGFTLAILLTEAVFLFFLKLPPAQATVGTPQSSTPGQVPAEPPEPAAVAPAVRYILAAVIIDLGLCFVLYENIWLRVLNFLVLAVLLATQYLLAARVVGRRWDKPLFWVEVLVSSLARPWVCLPDFSRSLLQLFRRPRPAASAAFASSASPASPAAPDGRENEPAATVPVSGGRLVGRVLLGLLLAFPVLLLAGSLLASADVIFAGYFTRLRDFLADLSLNDLFNNLLVAVILLPFIFSFLQSGRRRWRLLPGQAESSSEGWDRGAAKIWRRIDKTVLITFLSCINLLYLMFAFVQLAYLTGAFQAVLPENLTYAEYARSGFFELAAISVINLALILLTVKSTDRRRAAGLVLRIESLMLAAGSLVQWASAMFRMNMYVDVFGLTLLRFLVTAFMLLLFALFVLLLVKEFMPRFALFKAFTAAVLASLMILNHANCDAWIAAHNVRRYLNHNQQIDAEYFGELSVSAVPAMLRLVESGDAIVAAAIAGQLLDRYDRWEESAGDARWQRYNVSREQARRLVEANLGRLRELAPDPGQTARTTNN
ncbi:MAG TPA: hypothetical protein DD640_03550 [Clostridiales bacterium]|nr:hypothetical protein [Clostridiales bacterium]